MIKIFIATHKPGVIPQDDAFLPIHVGRSISAYKDIMSEFIGDDTGENISSKNASYCEMTAHYWIWKNVDDADYVGLCHYRRLFGIDISNDNIENILSCHDVIMVEPSYYMDSVYSYFAKFIGAENMTILWEVMKKLYPEYLDTLQSFCDGVFFYPFNMLVCRKSIYNRYAEWMFSILQKCELYIIPSPYTNARRALAYIAEMLTSVYFIYNQLKIKTVPYIKIEKGEKILVKHSLLENLQFTFYQFILKTIFSKKVLCDRKEKFENPAIILGLKHDGIL